MEEQQPLELRMYFLVPHNISPIQQAIQSGHAALEYADKFGSDEEFVRFVREYKTWIILNGGTTNDQRDFEDKPLGTLNQIAEQLLENDIQFSYFREPDLNNALTAVCFICDERVFNKKDYPDFIDYVANKSGINNSSFEYIHLKTMSIENIKEKYFEYYKEWVRFIGGIKNEFLRDILKDKKLT